MYILKKATPRSNFHNPTYNAPVEIKRLIAQETRPKEKRDKCFKSMKYSTQTQS